MLLHKQTQGLQTQPEHYACPQLAEVNVLKLPVCSLLVTVITSGCFLLILTFWGDSGAAGNWLQFFGGFLHDAFSYCSLAMSPWQHSCSTDLSIMQLHTAKHDNKGDPGQAVGLSHSSSIEVGVTVSGPET